MRKKQSPKHFLLVGNASYSNRGCEAIVGGTARILRRFFGSDADITQVYFAAGCCPVNNTAYGVRDIGIDATRRSFACRLRARLLKAAIPGLGKGAAVLSDMRVIRALFGADAVLMVGGDNFTFDYGRPDQFFAFNDVVGLMGKPYALWGASIGPFSSNTTFERAAARRLRRAPLICARESMTVSYLESIGVSSNVRTVCDPAFLLEPRRPALCETVAGMLEQGCIGLNLSALIGRCRQTEIHAWIKECADCVTDIARTTSMPILLIPHVMSSGGNVPADDWFLEKVAAESTASGRRVAVLDSRLSAAEIKHVIAACRIFAGARTHATIAAVSSAVPTLFIGYSMKARGIANDVYGDEQWLIDATHPSFSMQELAHRMSRLMHEHDAVRRHLAQRLPHLCDRAWLAGEYLAAVLPRTGDGTHGSAPTDKPIPQDISYDAV